MSRQNVLKLVLKIKDVYHLGPIWHNLGQSLSSLCLKVEAVFHSNWCSFWIKNDLHTVKINKSLRLRKKPLSGRDYIFKLHIAFSQWKKVDHGLNLHWCMPLSELKLHSKEHLLTWMVRKAGCLALLLITCIVILIVDSNIGWSCFRYVWLINKKKNNDINKVKIVGSNNCKPIIRWPQHIHVFDLSWNAERQQQKTNKQNNKKHDNELRLSSFMTLMITLLLTKPWSPKKILLII